ncbi:hypothetical protein ABVK25_000520 [Lepraria finkii]|uniref:Sugar phosphate transporter domain-containing protein n=1 Tax=Lepraria finkii TaxID=1340010 RepID=A0ABR4BRZ8_9LECA
MAAYLSLIPFFFGVGPATNSDWYFTALGFFLALLSVVLVSIKTLASNRLIKGNLEISPIKLLLRVLPFAALQSLLCAIFAEEASACLAWIQEGNLTPNNRLTLASKGCLAFLLNVSSFYTDRLTGDSFTVGANPDQCMTILLAVVVFDMHVDRLSVYGMTASAGALVYCQVKLDSMGKKEVSP